MSVCIPAGEWVCLKNVHLVVAWLPLLEKALRGLTPHPSFRLLLTSEPHPDFPPSLLEACLKVPYPTQLVSSCLLVLTEQGAQDRPPHNIPWAHTSMPATVCPPKAYVSDRCYMSTQCIICWLVRHLQMHTVALTSSQFTLCLEQLTSSAQAAQSGLCCANIAHVP